MFADSALRPTAHAPGFTAAFVRSVANAIEECGGSSENFLTDVALVADDSFAMPVAVDMFGRALDNAARAIAMPHLALEIARRVSLASFVTSSEAVEGTVFTALLRSAEDLPALGNTWRYSLAIDESGARIAQEQLAGDHAPIVVELLGALVARRIQELLGVTDVFTSVRFAHASPVDAAPYKAFFGMAPTFDANENAITFSPSLLAKSLSTGPVSGVTKRPGAAAKPGASHPLLTFVRRSVGERLAAGSNVPPVTELASRLAITPRSLQRRLKRFGLSYSNLVDEVRFEIAEGMLEQSAMPVSEIARRLGFNDVSAFSRAFRRWTGGSPRAFRKERRIASRAA